jgi:hypothetical protein
VRAGARPQGGRSEGHVPFLPRDASLPLVRWATGKGRLFGCALAALAGLSGCDPWHCAFESHGACIEFTRQPADLDAARRRVDALLDRELPYWGLSSLGGWRIQYRESSDYPCYLADRNDGCTDYVNHTLSVRVAADSRGCFEAAELLHELGHYRLGDPMHSSPEWDGVEAEFAPMVWDHVGASPECVERYGGIRTGMWHVNRNSF